MPTGNRQPFVRLAIANFLTQDYSGAELIIVDDGAEPTSVPQHERIRYCYCSPGKGQRITTGAKRNAANALARGETIVHWDDDDWYAPSRLSHQLEFFHRSGKLVTGYHSILYWDYSQGKGFKYDDPTFRPHAAGTSMVYAKSFWDTYKFDNRTVSEDFHFCMWARNVNQLASQDSDGMVVARLHGGNTCVPRLGTIKYPSVPDSKFPPAFLSTLL